MPKKGTKVAAASASATGKNPLKVKAKPSAEQKKKARERRKFKVTAVKGGKWQLSGRPDFLSKSTLTRSLLERYNAEQSKADMIAIPAKGKKLPNLTLLGLARAHTTSWKDIRDEHVTNAVNAKPSDAQAAAAAQTSLDVLWGTSAKATKSKSYVQAKKIVDQHFAGKKALTAAQVGRLAKLMNSAEPNLDLRDDIINSTVGEALHLNLPGGSATPKSRNAVKKHYQEGRGSSPKWTPGRDHILSKTGAVTPSPKTSKELTRKKAHKPLLFSISGAKSDDSSSGDESD